MYACADLNKNAILFENVFKNRFSSDRKNQFDSFQHNSEIRNTKEPISISFSLLNDLRIKTNDSQKYQTLKRFNSRRSIEVSRRGKCV